MAMRSFLVGMWLTLGDTSPRVSTSISLISKNQNVKIGMIIKSSNGTPTESA